MCFSFLRVLRVLRGYNRKDITTRWNPALFVMSHNTQYFSVFLLAFLVLAVFLSETGRGEENDFSSHRARFRSALEYVSLGTALAEEQMQRLRNLYFKRVQTRSDNFLDDYVAQSMIQELRDYEAVVTEKARMLPELIDQIQKGEGRESADGLMVDALSTLQKALRRYKGVYQAAIAEALLHLDDDRGVESVLEAFVEDALLPGTFVEAFRKGCDQWGDRRAGIVHDLEKTASKVHIYMKKLFEIFAVLSELDTSTAERIIMKNRFSIEKVTSVINYADMYSLWVLDWDEMPTHDQLKQLEDLLSTIPRILVEKKEISFAAPERRGSDSLPYTLTPVPSQLERISKEGFEIVLVRMGRYWVLEKGLRPKADYEKNSWQSESISYLLAAALKNHDNLSFMGHSHPNISGSAVDSRITFYPSFIDMDGVAERSPEQLEYILKASSDMPLILIAYDNHRVHSILKAEFSCIAPLQDVPVKQDLLPPGETAASADTLLLYLDDPDLKLAGFLPYTVDREHPRHPGLPVFYTDGSFFSTVPTFRAEAVRKHIVSTLAFQLSIPNTPEIRLVVRDNNGIVGYAQTYKSEEARYMLYDTFSRSNVESILSQRYPLAEHPEIREMSPDWINLDFWMREVLLTSREREVFLRNYLFSLLIGVGNDLDHVNLMVTYENDRFYITLDGYTYHRFSSGGLEYYLRSVRDHIQRWGSYYTEYAVTTLEAMKELDVELYFHTRFQAVKDVVSDSIDMSSLEWEAVSMNIKDYAGVVERIREVILETAKNIHPDSKKEAALSPPQGQ